MSELKSQIALLQGFSYVEYRAVYLKSEADEVIERISKQLRHQKHKRCLDKAKQCKRNRLNASVCGPATKIDFWNKWHKRWLEIAKKFKEAK